MTITLELPEDLVVQWESLPPDQRHESAVAALRQMLEDNDFSPDSSLSAEDITAIRAGVEAADAGRVMEGEAFFAQLRQNLGFSPRPLWDSHTTNNSLTCVS